MNVAIPVWRGRLSPVFDVAARLLIVEIDDGVEKARGEMSLALDDPHSRPARLREAGVDVLVCGAISWPMERAVASAGIEVIPQICGEVERVLAAFLAGELNRGSFLMPGCCGRRRRLRGRGRRCANRRRGVSDAPADPI